MKLKGKVAIVTGSTRGIGKAIAIRFAKEGARVVVNGVSDIKKCDDVVKEIKKFSGEAISILADVSKKADVEKMISETVKKFGRIDIIVNNAGILDMSDFLSLTEEHWDRILAVDLKGTFLCMQAAAKQMIKQGKNGKIVNISSIAGFVGFTRLAHYCAAKAGVIELTKEVAIELAPHKINVNAIAPGAIETDMTKDILADPQALKGFLGLIPLGRIGKPEDIASAALFLASDDANYVTGATLIVDGGWTIQ
ncbi:TPA: 3-oxoacyl-ACP reductase FabG [archaeon]|uniref:3-oxoacyl-ACP reductase FabG n=1 Tax=Candidatus Naiadarchaeum limnaeum TaxID=2756139 RepID=A0A832V9V4_9ARCH|nr:3-oxoacyl-ACP reductase FabG [Candidatus Naiadarchaeum limnaeum]